MKPLSEQEIEEICIEIETQWEYHLMTRAIFYSKFPEDNKYESPLFYSSYGFSFKIELPENKTESFNRASKGIGVWLNQNYVIRLFGILNSKGILKHGKENNSEIIILIDTLRNNIGAHSTGRRVSEKNNLKKATLLINKLFKRNINLDGVEHYILSVDSVLEPMKNQAIEYIKNMKE